MGLRVIQFSEVSGIYLGVPTEPPEILSDHGGIKKGKESDGKTSIKPASIGVEVVQVILKT